MATVHKLLPDSVEFIAELQKRTYIAEAHRHTRFRAAILIQRVVRGFLIRKHMAWLSYNATIIQCAFRVHRAKKSYRAALKRAVRMKHFKYYAKAAVRIQAFWRGHYSRKTKFCYKAYRRWLASVTERGARRSAEAADFGLISRADDLRILEEEARQWLAFVVFKLHHLLRTYSCAGIYSKPASTELSEFEKLIKAINYTHYMKRLKRKYDEFVRKHKPKFSNVCLFPIIGDGSDYWYLSLDEMYQLTQPSPQKENTRLLPFSHGPQHKQPFLWGKVKCPEKSEGRGPFTARTPIHAPRAHALALTPPTIQGGDADRTSGAKDPRFQLYVKHYKPRPDLMDYVDYHINALLRRKCALENSDKEM